MDIPSLEQMMTKAFRDLSLPQDTVTMCAKKAVEVDLAYRTLMAEYYAIENSILTHMDKRKEHED